MRLLLIAAFALVAVAAVVTWRMAPPPVDVMAPHAAELTKLH